MFLKKLRRGVLHVQTSNGLRCVQLSKRERLTLLWVFRHFTIISEAILGEQKSLVQALLASDRSQLRCANNHANEDDLVIGTVEMECVPVKKPAASAARVASASPKQIPAAADASALRSHAAS